MRCFLAVPLAEPALRAAQQLLATLRGAVASVRWARPETLHMTVHFFGVIEEADVERALAAVSPVADAAVRCDIELDRLGSFPPRAAPRVLWLGASAESMELTTLAMRCREVLRAARFAVEERPFRAHCTLGRPRLPWPETSSAAWRRASAAPLPAMRFSADRLALFESRPGPGGAVYTPLRTLLLGG